jgi:transposase
VISARPKAMKRVAQIPQAQLENNLPYFAHRITNAIAEGLIPKIQLIRYNARGHRDLVGLTMAIHFQCRGLDLDPCELNKPNTNPEEPLR